jgi:MOSC domain-containing protein YiiM
MTELLVTGQGIYTAPSAGKLMICHQIVEAVTDKGLAGDRYALNLGSWKKKGMDNHSRKRQLTIMSRHSLMVANRDRAGTDKFLEEETRRNVYANFDVNELIGRDFDIGEAICRGIEYAKPCDRPDKLCGKQGFEEAFFGNGGVNCVVLCGGHIGVRSPIRILPREF